METNVLAVGCLAYYDSFGGMVPCKVLTITGASGFPSSSQDVTLKVTADYNCYKKNEVIATNGLHAVPRGAHYYGPCGIGRIGVYWVEVA